VGRLRESNVRPWQVFVACLVVFLLMDVLGKRSDGPFTIGFGELFGSVCAAALFTMLWWFFWGRLRG